MINFDIFYHFPFFFLVSCFSRSAGDGCMVAHWPYWTRTDNRSSWLMQLGSPKTRGASSFSDSSKATRLPVFNGGLSGTQSSAILDNYYPHLSALQMNKSEWQTTKHPV